ncbi:hypothetical protein ACQ856_18160 [Mycolicibacterium psychrotolerans]|uniref:hypothetical protein n=1 Tax=Mycolicibacterium psychrotolerans TaxID=216929 RepID=UPI003D67D1FF
MNHQEAAAQGDKWLDQAVDTYTGGGAMQIAATEASIAAGFYARAALTQAGIPLNTTIPQGYRRDPVDASVDRHPAGKQRPETRHLGHGCAMDPHRTPLARVRKCAYVTQAEQETAP